MKSMDRLTGSIWAQTFALNLRKFITPEAKQVTRIKNVIFGWVGKAWDDFYINVPYLSEEFELKQE